MPFCSMIMALSCIAHSCWFEGSIFRSHQGLVASSWLVPCSMLLHGCSCFRGFLDRWGWAGAVENYNDDDYCDCICHG